MTTETVDTFAYDGRRVRAVWCPAPWSPPRDLVRQCSGLCFDPDGQVVLVSQDGNSWSLPGGHLEPGESPAKAFCRELYEEACATVVECAYLGCQRIEESDADGQQLPVYYQARYWARVRLDEFVSRYETIHRRLVPVEALPATLGWGESPILTEIITLCRRVEAMEHQA